MPGRAQGSCRTQTPFTQVFPRAENTRALDRCTQPGQWPSHPCGTARHRRGFAHAGRVRPGNRHSPRYCPDTEPEQAGSAGDGSAQGRGGETAQLLHSPQHRPAPCPAWVALPHEQDVITPGTGAGAEASRNTRVTPGQATARAPSGRGWARGCGDLPHSVYYLKS